MISNTAFLKGGIMKTSQNTVTAADKSQLCQARGEETNRKKMDTKEIKQQFQMSLSVARPEIMMVGQIHSE